MTRGLVGASRLIDRQLVKRPSNDGFAVFFIEYFSSSRSVTNDAVNI